MYNPERIAQMFNNYFSSVYGPETIDEFVKKLNSSKTSIKIKTEIVLKAIKSNGSQYAVGINAILHIFWKRNCHVIVSPLTKIFHKFIDTGYILSLWKRDN